jgi:protein-S-isoprenylcysteine O-methyltransferase Ste14
MRRLPDQPREWREHVGWHNVPLPEGHLAALAAGLMLQKRMPLGGSMPAIMRRAIGPLVAMLGVLVTAWAVEAVRGVDVTAPETLVTHGPYARSRNPMYVGWTVMYVGVALTGGSRWLLILLPGALAYTHVAVLREERRLEGRFGLEYRSYRGRVRRYL